MMWGIGWRNYMDPVIKQIEHHVSKGNCTYRQVRDITGIAKDEDFAEYVRKTNMETQHKLVLLLATAGKGGFTEACSALSVNPMHFMESVDGTPMYETAKKVIAWGYIAAAQRDMDDIPDDQIAQKAALSMKLATSMAPRLNSKDFSETIEHNVGGELHLRDLMLGNAENRRERAKEFDIVDITPTEVHGEG